MTEYLNPGNAHRRQAVNRLPNWRWRVVLYQMTTPTQGRNLRVDKDLHAALAYCRSKKRGNYNGMDQFFHKFRHILESVKLYSDTRPGSMRWILEALAIAGNDPAESLMALGCSGANNILSVETVRMYRSLFFDLEQYGTAVPPYKNPLVMSHVLDLSGSSLTHTSDCDFLWKMFAVKWGTDLFVKHMVLREPFAKEVSDWLRQTITNNLLMQAYVRSEELRVGFNEEAVQILHSASKFLSDVQTQELDKYEDRAKREFVHNMTRAVQYCLQESGALPALEEHLKDSQFADFSYSDHQRAG